MFQRVKRLGQDSRTRHQGQSEVSEGIDSTNSLRKFSTVEVWDVLTATSGGRGSTRAGISNPGGHIQRRPFPEILVISRSPWRPRVDVSTSGVLCEPDIKRGRHRGGECSCPGPRRIVSQHSRAREWRAQDRRQREVVFHEEVLVTGTIRKTIQSKAGGIRDWV